MEWQDAIKIIAVILAIGGTAFGAVRFVTIEREKQIRSANQISELQQRLELVAASVREGVNRYESLKDISTSSQTAIGADFHSISVPVPRDNPTHLKIIVSTDPEATKIIGKEYPLTKGLGGKVFKTQIPEYVNRANEDPNHYAVVDQAAGTKTGEGGILSVPLKRKNSCIGVVQYMKKPSENMFSEEDINIISRFKEKISNELIKVEESAQGDAILGAFPRVFCSILFSDINSFGEIARKISLQQAVNFIDEYYRRLLEIAIQHGAAFAEYIGDGIYLSFQGQTKQDTVYTAINCAKKMQRVFDDLRKEWIIYQYPILDDNYHNIGIASGEVFEGTVGHPQFRKRKLIGPAVDLSAHLVELGKQFGSCIIVDKVSYQMVSMMDIKISLIPGKKDCFIVMDEQR